MLFPCFILEHYAVLHARIIAKMDCSFTSFTRFGACIDADVPHFSALDTQNSTSAPLSRCQESPFIISQTTIWDIPFRLLGYPILPFGMSHFTIWGIFSAHLRTMYSPDFRFVFFVFRCKSLCVSFLSVHHVSSGFAWLDKIYFITLS